MEKIAARSPHYGWVIAFCGALTLFACLGLARFSFGLLLPGMRQGLGLAFGEMGFISTGNFAGYLLAVALAPRVIRRLRPRATVVLGLLLVAGGMLGIGGSSSLVAVVLLYGLVGVGSGFANIPVMTLVSHWFRRDKRGRAAGLMVMGNGTAIILAGWLIPVIERSASAGWRLGWVVLGLATLGVTAAVGVLLRNDPADLGVEPVGTLQPLAPEAIAARDETGAGRILVHLGVLYLLFGATYMVYGTFIVTTMVTDYAFSEAQAGMFWSWVGFFSLFSGIAFGALSDRIGRRAGLVAVFSLQTVAYLLAGTGLGTPALLLSVLFYGLALFATPTIMAAAVGDYLGLPRAAAGFSLVTLFFAVGQTAGPGLAGVLAEYSGSFGHSYLAAAALIAAGALLSALLPRQHG